MQDNSDLDGGFTASATYGNDGVFGVDNAFPEDNRFPSALSCGGGWNDAPYAGVFALNAIDASSGSNSSIGFRCVR